MTDSILWTLLAVGYFLTWLMIPWVLLKRSVHSSASVAWILAILFVPYLGPLLCLLIGTTRWERRSERKRAASTHVDEHMPHYVKELVATEQELGAWETAARLVTQLTGAPVLSGNEVRLLPDTNRSMEVVEEIIESAERWIHVEFYIWKQDSTGTKIRDLLIRKAEAGLQVRFLYDGVGSMLLSRKFLHPMKKAGVQIATFTPGFQLWHVLTWNLRNHRKLVVTDQQAGFTGGMNIGDEYIRPTKSYGHWRDTQLLVRGPAAAEMQRVFAEDWLYATGEVLTDPQYFPEPQRRGDVPAQVVADGPDNNVDTFYMLAVAALGQAQERVTLTTPYFVPPHGLAVALATAATRGVRVRMMVAERGNFAWTLHAGRSYYEPLLAAGVEIYEYGKGIYHAKTLSVDGQWSLVGTANWDYRSLYLNFEVAVSLFDRQLAEDLERQFETDRQHARQIEYDQWQQRPTLTVLKEEFWRLFAPTL